MSEAAITRYAPTPGSIAERLIKVINQHPSGIRTHELSELAGDVKPENVSGILATAVKHGLITVCSVIKPGTRQSTKEYRTGPGMEHASEKTLKPMKSTVIPVRSAEAPIIDKPLPKADAYTHQPKAELPPSLPHMPIRVRKPDPILPKTASYQISGKLGLSIDHDASLCISTDEDVVELSPSQVLALGDFLHATEGLWRP